MLFFTFIKGGGDHPPDRTPESQWFFVNNLGGGVKSLLTNVNKKMVFFNEGFPNGKQNIKASSDLFSSEFDVIPKKQRYNILTLMLYYRILSIDCTFVNNCQ